MKSPCYLFLMVLLLVRGVCAQEQGPFCGIVGTDGCIAIEATDNRILGWATGCSIVRGPVDIRGHADSIVSFGTESEAIGQAWTNTVYGVVSLGDAGYATLTFDHPIANGEGYDFVVFENSFDDLFLELAFVEVSSDGINFVRFPATSLTQTETQIGGIGHMDATYINNLAGKFRGGWGTPFDLDELRDSSAIDINNITHVRIVDVVGSIDPEYGSYDAFGHLVNDPFPTFSYSAGFDLDGVGVLNFNQPADIQQSDRTPSEPFRVFPNPANNWATIHTDISTEALLFDISGQLVRHFFLVKGDNRIETSALKEGVYILRLQGKTERITILR